MNLMKIVASIAISGAASFAAIGLGAATAHADDGHGHGHGHGNWDWEDDHGPGDWRGPYYGPARYGPGFVGGCVSATGPYGYVNANFCV